MLLNKHNLALADFVSKEATRYTLQALHVSDKGTCATDGHVAVRVSLPDVEGRHFPTITGVIPVNGDAKPFLLDSATAKRIAAAIPKKQTLPILMNAVVGQGDEISACLAVTDLEVPQVFRPRFVQGQFPNVDAVIPSRETTPTFEIAVSADLLAKVAKAAAQFSDQSTKYNTSKAPVLLKFYGNDKAFTLQAKRDETKQSFLAVLMPVTLDETKAGY